MLVKKSTLRLMYKAGNKKVQELVDGGVSLKLLTKGDNREEIRLAMMRAIEIKPAADEEHRGISPKERREQNAKLRSRQAQFGFHEWCCD